MMGRSIQSRTVLFMTNVFKLIFCFNWSSTTLVCVVRHPGMYLISMAHGLCQFVLSLRFSCSFYVYVDAACVVSCRIKFVREERVRMVNVSPYCMNFKTKRAMMKKEKVEQCLQEGGNSMDSTSRIIFKGRTELDFFLLGLSEGFGSLICHIIHILHIYVRTIGIFFEMEIFVLCDFTLYAMRYFLFVNKKIFSNIV